MGKSGSEGFESRTREEREGLRVMRVMRIIGQVGVSGHVVRTERVEGTISTNQAIPSGVNAYRAETDDARVGVEVNQNR